MFSARNEFDISKHARTILFISETFTQKILIFLFKEIYQQAAL